MIVAATAQLREQRSRLGNQKQVRTAINQITETRFAIDELSDVALEVVNTFKLNRDRLNPEDSKRIFERLVALEQSVRGSRSRFESGTAELRQVVSLGIAKNSAASIAVDLDQSWSTISTATAGRYRDLLALVRQLPELTSEADSLRQALGELDKLTGRAPRTVGDVAGYDDRLAQAEQSYRALDRLPPNVLEFLGRVLSNTATLDDLSIESFEWLGAHGHRSSLIIRFPAGE